MYTCSYVMYVYTLNFTTSLDDGFRAVMVQSSLTNLESRSGILK